MRPHTDSSKNDVLYRYLKVLSKCYSTGYFDELFPLLSENAVMESQWVLTPNEGKPAVIDYYIGKGETMREHNCLPHCDLVRFIGNLNMKRNVMMNVNGEESFGSFGLMYENEKYAMLMRQTIGGKTNAVIVDLTLDENDMIARIDLCMPELFRFEIVDE